MKPPQWVLLMALVAAGDATVGAQSGSAIPGDLAPPVEEGPFIRPASGPNAEPIWGLRDGMRIGLWPLPGPRGLLRVYTPYLDQPHDRVINFIAVEPIIDGPRGLSELEPSQRDGKRGKWFEPANRRDAPPALPWLPPRGEIVALQRGKPALSIYFHVEKFQNGARPIVQALFRPEKPYEVELRVFAAPDSAPMKSCILTATMGNFARLRKLWLADEVVEAKQLWPEYKPEGWGFAPQVSWPAERLHVDGAMVMVVSTSDETEPAHAQYDPAVAAHWHYVGKPATQYWKAPIQDDLVARVNGRVTYWASQAPIPGGVSFENFELEAPFRQGQSFTFGVTTAAPAEPGFSRGRESALK